MFMYSMKMNQTLRRHCTPFEAQSIFHRPDWSWLAPKHPLWCHSNGYQTHNNQRAMEKNIEHFKHPVAVAFESDEFTVIVCVRVCGITHTYRCRKIMGNQCLLFMLCELCAIKYSVQQLNQWHLTSLSYASIVSAARATQPTHTR